MKRTLIFLVFLGSAALCSVFILGYFFAEGHKEKTARQQMAIERYKTLKNGGEVIFSIEEFNPRPHELNLIYQQGPEMTDLEVLVRLRKTEKD